MNRVPWNILKHFHPNRKNKVKSLVLADQDGNEITEVKYDRDACQVTMIHANKTVCWISAEKK